MQWKGIVFFCIISICYSGTCDREDLITDNEFVGTWKLTEILADPGNGKGVFIQTNSDKQITFTNELTIESNASLCGFSQSDGESYSATYSIELRQINALNCPAAVSFELIDDELILSYICIEPCREKYRRVKTR